jgi:phosphotransferase system HPr (HPr) family protein
MVTRTIDMNTADDWQMKSAALLTQKASAFRSSIFLTKAERRANAKSLLGVMSLGIEKGDEIIVTAEGEDEDAALEAIASYLEQPEEQE